MLREILSPFGFSQTEQILECCFSISGKMFYSEEFKLLVDKIEHLLQLHGSEASSLQDIADDFGELKSSTGPSIGPSVGSDDEYDFISR